MAHFRGLQIALTAAVLTGSTFAGAVGVPGLKIVARDGGTLLVVNPTTDPIRLNGAVVVEGLHGQAWEPLSTEMNLIGSCPANGVAVTRPAVVLAAGQKLTPPRWRGWSCAGQCNAHCRSNLYWGSGPFRFRLTGATGAVFLTNSFRMPAQPGM